jgi:hypothetical protein
MYLEGNAGTAFGNAHNFDKIRGYKDFIRHVPLRNYDAFEPWVERIRKGETNVLAHERVTRLLPTSGSTGAHKLIPFTATLQHEFNAAIGPWLVDLQFKRPGLVTGPSYWSITPSLKVSLAEESVVPVGFDTDTAYLGGARKRLAEAVMAVPADVQGAKTVDAFRYETSLHLLRCHELRLISVWHPSFLILLLDALPTHWAQLIEELRCGRDRSLPPLTQRADELSAIGPHDPARIWPHLRVISCWGEGNAEMGVEQIKQRFPNAIVQRKGLLATEAVVTIPFSGSQVLAVRSHFFEFLDVSGRVHMAHELQAGAEYEVVVTTGGGLWRYRLQDMVRVTGFVGNTPSLQFLGRTEDFSDCFGEKLSDGFVAETIRLATVNLPSPRFALLAPDREEAGWYYTLYIEGKLEPGLAVRLDTLLRKNPHYAWCRELGQLGMPRIFRIKTGGFQAYAMHECANGKRLGEVKPRSLSPQAGWSHIFTGNYLPADCKSDPLAQLPAPV